MASSRILFGNFFTDVPVAGTIFASGGAVAQSNAQVSGPQPFKQGFASLVAGGTYNDIIEVLYWVECTTGGSFAAARYRWTDNFQGTATVWNASDLTPLNGTPVALNRGVTITFTQVGSFTPQFVVGDTWLFQVVLKYGYPKAFDAIRDTEWRSGTMPAGSTIEWHADFGSAVLPTAFALLDHNIPSNATITLKIKSTGFTDPPDVTIPITWNPNRLVALLSTSARRYWRVCVTLGATSLPYLRWSEIFLGSSLVFDRTFDIGFSRARRRVGPISVETLRRGPGPRLLEGHVLNLTYASMSTPDRARMNQLWEWTHDATHNIQRPFIVLLLDSQLDDFSLYQWTNDYEGNHRFLERYDTPVEWQEVVRSLAS